MKQTAVEWLYYHLFPKQLDGFSNDEWDKIDKAFEQAKELDKQQKIDAWNDGNCNTDLKGNPSANYAITAEHYYTQEYGGEK